MSEVDGALRSSQRAGDALAQASALRRSGQEGAARRVLRDAAWAGEGRALERLEAWFPLPARTFQLLGWIESAVQGPEPGPRMAFGLACELLGCGDPRIDGPLGPVLRRCVVGGAHDPWVHLVDAWAEPALVPRLTRLLRDWQGARALSRAWLWQDEALALADALGQPAPRLDLAPGMAPALLPLWILGRFGGEGGWPALEAALQDPSARVRLAAAQGLSRSGRPLPPTVRGLPAAPAWAEPVDPAWRDPFSGAWDRRFLRKHWQGSHLEAPPAVANEPAPRAPALADSGLWVLLIDVDGLRRINDAQGNAMGDRVLLAVADVLVEQAGDRVSRWSGDEFLVHWEGQDGPALGEAIRAGVAGLELEGLGGRPLRATVTVGVTRSGPFASAYQRADQALYQPRNEGLRDVVRVLA